MAEVMRPGVDAAGTAADPLGEFHKVFFIRAKFQQGAPEQSHVREQGLRDAVQVKAQVEVDDAIGEEVVVVAPAPDPSRRWPAARP